MLVNREESWLLCKRSERQGGLQGAPFATWACPSVGVGWGGVMGPVAVSVSMRFASLFQLTATVSCSSWGCLDSACKRQAKKDGLPLHLPLHRPRPQSDKQGLQCGSLRKDFVMPATAPYRPLGRQAESRVGGERSSGVRVSPLVLDHLPHVKDQEQTPRPSPGQRQQGETCSQKPPPLVVRRIPPPQTTQQHVAQGPGREVLKSSLP